MADFKVGMEMLDKLEGRFSDNPNDRGGKTKFGITESTLKAAYLRKLVAHNDITKLNKAEAAIIYKKFYWDAMGLDEISDQDIANEIFECGVNCGTGSAIQYFQGALRTFDQKTEIDGVVGPATILAFNAAVGKWKHEILEIQNYQQGMHYARICQGDATQLAFLKGWLGKRVCLPPEKNK